MVVCQNFLFELKKKKPKWKKKKIIENEMR